MGDASYSPPGCKALFRTAFSHALSEIFYSERPKGKCPGIDPDALVIELSSHFRKIDFKNLLDERIGKESYCV